MMRRPAFLFLLLLTVSCRLTDHSERDGDEVTTESLNFPASGYEDVDPADLPQLTFDSSNADMGRVIQGTRVDKSYTFTNTGGAPLVITDVRSTCGCTVGKDWPKQPIAPGAGGTISVSFNSEGRSGRQEKTITVVANTSPPSTVLTLTGEVIGPASSPE
ncbi:MAG TPA: DUF1573 domain-containing protein [Flavobacteriales bacterium]|nr:DUF1573 domain-containing protein [Flavobacteriales bacterium]